MNTDNSGKTFGNVAAKTKVSCSVLEVY